MGKAPVFEIPDVAKRLVERLTDIACEVNFVDRPADEPLFAESYLLDSFDAFRAVQLLADNRQSFYGHKEAVYAAFCGWIIAPMGGLIYDLVCATIYQLLEAAEELASDLPHTAMIDQDIFARYFIAGPQFIEQLYNAVGGISGAEATASRDEIDDIVNADYKAEVSVLQMMRYCHYWSSKPGLKIRPSVRRAISAVKQEVDTDNVWASEASIYEVWAIMKPTIALSYAASTISVGEGVLSDQWSGGKFDYREQCDFIPLLLGRARYVCDHILAKMHDPALFEVNLEPLREVAPLKFDIPDLDAQEQSVATDPNVNKKRLIKRAQATRARIAHTKR